MKEPITFESPVLQEAVPGERITVRVDGIDEDAVLAGWAEIRTLGFGPGESVFCLLPDGTPARLFHRWDPQEERTLWLVTTDPLEEIVGARLKTASDLANWMIGCRLRWTCRNGDFEEAAIRSVEKIHAHAASLRWGHQKLYLTEGTMRSLLEKGTARIPGDITLTIF